MIKESLEMFKNGEINNEYLKGKILFNASSKVQGCHFGKVVGFYIGGPENKTHEGKRLFTVEKLDTKEQINWWLDLKDGLNPNLFLIEDDIIIRPKRMSTFNKGRKIGEFSPNGRKIREFVSVTEASFALNINEQYIREYCKGTRKTPTGLIYRYI